MLARFTGAGLGAAAITFSLVFLMQFLIGREKVVLTEDDLPRIDLPFWEGDPEPEPVRQGRIKPEKVEVEVPPIIDPPVIPTGETDEGLVVERVIEIDDTAPPDDFGTVAVANQGPYPIIRVQHQFPPRAQRSGCTIYGFTITKTGGTRDIQVIDSSSRVFDRYGAKAIEQYRYNPPIMNGRSVEAPNQSIRLVWQLEGEELPDHPACR